MMGRQTLLPAHIEVVNDKPQSEEKDITWRYRLGYERLRGRGFDLIALIENDDWYAPDYLEQMVAAWKQHGEPDIFGTNYTIYYHLKLRGWFVMNHDTRSSAMSTLIRPDLSLSWPVDKDPYTDLHLWWKCGLKGITFRPEKHLCIGMKHGEGKCGGNNHLNKLERYVNADPDLLFLQNHLDIDSLKFYLNLCAATK